MAYDIIKNLNTLTLIKPSILNNLVKISENCICDAILDTTNLDNDIAEVDIGIGTLYAKLSDDTISYKFVPSKKLERKIVHTVNSGESVLVKDIEEKLNQKLFNTYKELL